MTSTAFAITSLQLLIFTKCAAANHKTSIERGYKFYYTFFKDYTGKYAVLGDSDYQRGRYSADLVGCLIDLKPCFERYTGQRLTDLAPFHSEWRMRAPENCLLFCALSASRCRSVVHDMLQHVCYYYLDDGQKHARIARGMVYFRVNERKCLDQFLNKASSALLDSESGIYPETFPSTLGYETTRGFIEVQWPVVAYANSLIHVPSDGRALTPLPYFDSTRKLKKFQELYEVTTDVTKAITVTTEEATATPPLLTTFPTDDTTIIADGTAISTTDNTVLKVVSDPSFPTEFSSKTPFLEEKTPEIYDEILELRTASELNITPASGTLKTDVHRDSDIPFTADATFFVGNAGKMTKYNPDPEKHLPSSDGSTDDELSKLLKTIPDEIRRSPLKSSLMTPERLSEGTGAIGSFDKEKSYMMGKSMPVATIRSISMTLSEHDDEKMGRILSPACRSGEHDVWIAVENAILQNNSPPKQTSAESYQSCKAKCNLITRAGKDCPLFTYYEVERQCLLHTNNATALSSLIFLPSPKIDFNIRTAIKFCYPESLTVFEQCSEFIAFRDYTLNVEPREQFDDMPYGRDGLHACIELCVLASDFHCKSATFDTKTGKCYLRSEDSLSSPEYFREHQNYGLIYFENGCEQSDDEGVLMEAQIERVTTLPIDDQWAESEHFYAHSYTEN